MKLLRFSTFLTYWIYWVIIIATVWGLLDHLIIISYWQKGSFVETGPLRGSISKQLLNIHGGSGPSYPTVLQALLDSLRGSSGPSDTDEHTCTGHDAAPHRALSKRFGLTFFTVFSRFFHGPRQKAFALHGLARVANFTLISRFYVAWTTRNILSKRPGSGVLNKPRRKPYLISKPRNP